MVKIEKILLEKKTEIDKLEAPDEMESRLRNVLDKENIKYKPKQRNLIKIACFLLVIVFFGYNLDTLAFYSKKIIGYDNVMSDSLKEINELGKGQTIGKSYTFTNGTIVTLDGIMLDDNQLLLFYTEKNPNGKIDENGISGLMSLKGLVGTYESSGGSGEANDDFTEIKWIMSFETPYFFEKNLKWEFSIMDGGNSEKGEIEFKIDRNKAMGHSLKAKLNDKIKVDEREISIDSILASATTTVINGTAFNSLELSKDYFSGERIRLENIDFKLIANGMELKQQSSGMSTNLNGIKFHSSFEPLPENLKTLQLKLVSLGADYDAKETIELNKDEKNKFFEINGQKIDIQDIYEENGDTYVTISSEESVILTSVYLVEDNIKVELSETILDQEDKTLDGKIIHTRTLHFEGNGSKLELYVDRIRYSKEYNEIIDIPVNR